MNIPKYWSKSEQVVKPPTGRALKLVCWQWSDVSMDEARQRADDRVKEVAGKAMSGAELNRYSYGERPLREEITQSVKNGAGREIAVVTRNLYGALVLNAASALFIDIDFPEKNTGGSKGLFSGKPTSPEDPYLQRMSAWAARHPDLSVRVYRTSAGLRGLVTNALFEPGQGESADILSELEADPLYSRLCQAQACFRARLTPKPWRCGIGLPPARYPWENAALETRVRDWQRRYDKVIASFSVCKLLKQLGPDEVHPDIEPVLRLHDELTGIAAERKLA